MAGQSSSSAFPPALSPSLPLLPTYSTAFSRALNWGEKKSQNHQVSAYLPYPRVAKHTQLLACPFILVSTLERGQLKKIFSYSHLSSEVNTAWAICLRFCLLSFIDLHSAECLGSNHGLYLPVACKPSPAFLSGSHMGTSPCLPLRATSPPTFTPHPSHPPSSQHPFQKRASPAPCFLASYSPVLHYSGFGCQPPEATFH